MNFKINDSRYNSSFISAKGFTHNKGSLIVVYPFATDTKLLKESAQDFKSFKGVTGEFFRVSRNLSIEKIIDKERLLNSVVDTVATDHRHELKSVLNELFFDDDNEIVLFDPEILPYLSHKFPNIRLTELQTFVSNLLIDAEVKEIIDQFYNGDNTGNILYTLVLDNFKNTINNEPKTNNLKGKYQGVIVDEIRKLFKNDLRQLVNHQEFLIENIANLIKYYYFQYIIRLTNQLNLLFEYNKKPKPLFYSLEWEKLSRSRFCLEYGWNKLEHLMDDSFVHATCLELLNTIEGPHGCFATGRAFAYEEIQNTVRQLSDDGVNDLAKVLTDLVDRYTRDISNVERDNDKFSWDNFIPNQKIETSDWSQYHPLNLIDKLFQLIKYQFKNTGRRVPYSEYKLWFINFVKSNYIKYRGSLGPTLKIDRSLLILLTEISIQATSEEKIILNKLWSEFEKRGLYLDTESKKEVIAFFEKVNMLEKKSDSGDAQYVRSLLIK